MTVDLSIFTCGLRSSLICLLEAKKVRVHYQVNVDSFARSLEEYFVKHLFLGKNSTQGYLTIHDPRRYVTVF